MFTYGFRIDNLGYFEIERHKIVNYFWGNESKVLELEQEAIHNYNALFIHGDICFYVNYHGEVE